MCGDWEILTFLVPVRRGDWNVPNHAPDEAPDLVLGALLALHDEHIHELEPAAHQPLVCAWERKRSITSLRVWVRNRYHSRTVSKYRVNLPVGLCQFTGTVSLYRRTVSIDHSTP